MNTNLILTKTDMFDGVEYNIYSNDIDEMFMTAEQLGACLQFANAGKGIDNIVARNEYLKNAEFSVTLKLRATDGKCYNTRVFTEDGIYEVTMLAKTEVAKKFRQRVRMVLKDIRKGNIDYVKNPCAAAVAKDMISKWKRRVSAPLVKRLHTIGILGEGRDLADIYANIYRLMKSEYGFDLNDARENFSRKYGLPLRECAVIDAAADDRELRAAFVACADREIRDTARRKVESALQCEKCSIDILGDIAKAGVELECEFARVPSAGRECGVTEPIWLGSC